MSSDPDTYAPPVKMERLDHELDMVNYEMAMQIDVPNDAIDEIDPLMPVETNEDPADDVQPSVVFDFVRPIRDLQIKQESDSSLPKIDSVVSNFILPNGRIRESVVIKRTQSSARSDDDDDEFMPQVTKEIYYSGDENSGSEEVAIESNIEKVFRGGSDSSDCEFHQVAGAVRPQIQQLGRSQHLSKEQQTSALMSQLLKPPKSNNQLSVSDRAVDGVHKNMPYFGRPLNRARQNLSLTQPNASLQYDQDISIPTDFPPTVSTDGGANTILRGKAGMVGTHPETPSTSFPTVHRKNGMGQKKANSMMSHSSPPVTVPSILATGASSQEFANKAPSLILEPMSVSQLLETPFLSDAWTADQKKDIIKLSRPQPKIDTLRDTSADRYYSQIPWLCGSSSLRKFFCWPCLLFFYTPSHTQLMWSVSATLAIGRGFRSMCKAHEVAHTHQAAEKALASWLQNGNSPTSQKLMDKQKRNISAEEKVRKNRKLLSLLVQSICYLKKENHLAKLDDFAECFSYIVPFNWELQETLREIQGNMSKESSKSFVYNYAQPVIQAVEKCLESKKSDEIKMARFVTLFMEDFSSTVDDSNVAVVAHFVDQSGEIKERLIDINEISYDRSASAVFMLFQRVIFKHSLRLKVAGFTYSSTLIYPSDVIDFNERVERLCPYAKFFHYQGHNLIGMLFGAFSHLNKSCKNFFQTITELQEFFNKHLVPTFHHFEQLNQQELPNLSYDFDCGFIINLKRGYSSVLQTFGCILARPDEWDHSVSSQAPIYMSFLQDNTTRFLIVLISQLNLVVTDLAAALQGKIDAAEWKQHIHRAIESFISIKSFGLQNVYAASLNAVLESDSLGQTSDVPQHLVAIFNDIIDIGVSFLRQRFDTVDFGYVDLGTVASEYYKRLRLSPDDIHRFRLQIQLLAKEPLVKGKSLAEALKYFHANNMAAAVPEYATFLDFSMTIPSLRSSLHCPAVERILSQRRPSRKRLPSRNLIWMEKELLGAVLKNKKLCESIIDLIISNNDMRECSYEKL